MGGGLPPVDEDVKDTLLLPAVRHPETLAGLSETVGGVLTVTTTLWVLVHPVAVMVSVNVYVVVTVGLTVGLDMFEVKPAGLEVHE